MNVFWIGIGVVLMIVVIAIVRSAARGPAVTLPPPNLPSLAEVDPAILERIRAGRKIEAIKLYRERYGIGLKDAKEAVEALERDLRGAF